MSLIFIFSCTKFESTPHNFLSTHYPLKSGIRRKYAGRSSSLVELEINVIALACLFSCLHVWVGFEGSLNAAWKLLGGSCEAIEIAGREAPGKLLVDSWEVSESLTGRS